jgi:hypothetical protein
MESNVQEKYECLCTSDFKPNWPARHNSIDNSKNRANSHEKADLDKKEFAVIIRTRRGTEAI